jgi:hypothetical protein
MSEQLSVKYYDITISYSEQNNRWEFELRGRERYAESLAKAKEAIDKPVFDKSGKKFIPVRAILRDYSGAHPGTITSIAESSYRSQQVWFVRDDDKRRSKENLSSMREESESNLRLLEESTTLCAEADVLIEKAHSKRESMKPIKIIIPE